MNIYLFSDGIGLARYLVDVNGLRPAKVMWQQSTLIEQTIVVNKETDILLFVLQGCTTIRPIDSINILNKVYDLKVFKDIVVYTNIPLIGYKHPYILYEGDIFSGREAHINDILGILSETQITASIKKQPEVLIKKFCTEPQYKSKTCSVIGKPYMAKDVPDYSTIAILDNLKAVDIFD